VLASRFSPEEEHDEEAEAGEWAPDPKQAAHAHLPPCIPAPTDDARPPPTPHHSLVRSDSHSAQALLAAAAAAATSPAGGATAVRHAAGGVRAAAAAVSFKDPIEIPNESQGPY
jgi:hypothetical protein